MIDNLPPEIGVPLALVLWTIVLVMAVRGLRGKRKANK